ncbi:hypothetical protein [Mycobacteroides chelonae]|uniref:Uncharacterized protein n=1 Tax=Mycobacteroides chelonae TaxID=1774 RepID=A0A1S1LZ89_MYCCH|nr:hypothetical protein [Mycobacteroides chelonae]OHU73225.1 hypothetical protein BKG84_28765 [Mycobacteroides chelonae]
MANVSRVPAAAAVLSGLLAVAAALGAGHLVAGLLLTAEASPFYRTAAIPSPGSTILVCGRKDAV